MGHICSIGRSRVKVTLVHGAIDIRVPSSLLYICNNLLLVVHFSCLVLISNRMPTEIFQTSSLMDHATLVSQNISIIIYITCISLYGLRTNLT